MNEFAWRYFIIIIFGVFFVGAISIARILSSVGKRASTLVAVIALVIALVFTISRPVEYKDYSAFKKADDVSLAGHGLYAGDYWIVWPTVLRDMMQGYEAYGLTHRGQANREAARRYVSQKISSAGHVDVFCVEKNAEKCFDYINAVLGASYLMTPLAQDLGENKIRLSGHENNFIFKGDRFMRLPAQVGTIENGARRTNGKRGFIMYGPYFPLMAGRYRLTVYGKSKIPTGSYVDISSESGKKIHAKFDLGNKSDGFLLSDAAFDILTNVTDVEVRIWVDESTEIELFGYELRPIL